MAGTLLLISHNPEEIQKFSEIQAKLRLKVQEVFGKFYQHISYSQPQPDCFLIEFRKSNESKFYKHKNGSWLTFEGTVFALNETQSYSAEQLLSVYLNAKEEFPNLLDGHFVIKLYDAEQNTYVVINDFIKNKTNFICETDHYTMFTPFAITTGAIKMPKLDKEAFNEFMWRYYILSEKSILESVVRLSPASVYSVSKGEVSKITYWNWPDSYSKIPFKESVDIMYSSMKETAKLISKKFGKPCIDFTMGQDSRQVISAFTNQKIDFTTTIFGKSDFYEVQKIKKIAENFSIENTNIQLKEDYVEQLEQHFNNSVLLSSCDEPGYLLGRIIYMRKQQAKLGKVCLNGMDGHFYKNGLWDEMYTFNLYREPKEFNVNSFLKLRALSSRYDDSIFTDDFITIKNQSPEYFRRIIKDSIKEYLKSPVSMQVDRFDLYHWLNFTTVSNNAGNLIHNSISPLLLRRNLEFAIQIPVKWKFNLSKFQRALVYKLDKNFANVKTDFAGVNMVPKNIFTLIPFYLRYFYFQSARLRNKIKSKLGWKVTSHLHEAWDYLPLYKKLLSEKCFKENLDYKTLILNTIIKENEWEELIKKFDNPDDLNLNDFEYLFKIISVEYFLKEAFTFHQ